MRVGLVIYGSLETISGGYLYDRILVEHLRHQGHQVVIFSLPWRTYGRHLGDNLSRALMRQLREASLDVLLQDELNHPSLFWFNRRLRDLVRYPIIGIVHHLRCSEARLAWQNRIYRWVERRYLATLDGCRAAVVAYPGGDRLQPNLTPAQIVARAWQPGPLHLLFIGNLIPRKGLHALLSGLSYLNQDSWRLEVVGGQKVDPAYVHAVRGQIAGAGLTRQVTLSGSLSDTELAVRLAQSHLLVVPSSYEGFGIVYLEAMGFGLPAIASTAGAAREIITHGRDGFLVAPGDAATLARHVQALSQDRARLLQMGLAAYQRYMAHPTWTESAERICQFLRTCVR
ncbi:MAG: glycosyltransferase family 4 protein [Anaerolineae bacterium]